MTNSNKCSIILIRTTVLTQNEGRSYWLVLPSNFVTRYKHISNNAISAKNNVTILGYTWLQGGEKLADFVCKSTFCVINNPRYDITYRHNEKGEIIKDENSKPEILTQEPTEYCHMTEQQICDEVINKWVADGEEQTGAVLYCISALGLEHLHCVFESKKSFRANSVLKRLFPKVHISATKGNKKQVEDYINKVGKFEEKGEKVIAKSQVGEIIGCQGKRTDLITLDKIKVLIDDGLTPKEIFISHPKSLKEERAVNYLYFAKRQADVPVVRDVHVTWLCGSTGCGKSYKYVQLCEEYGEDNVYLVSDYTNPFDGYMGQDVIVFDEFRGQFRLAETLMYLDVYKRDIRARYSNKVSLWTQVYITSPVTPYEVYNQYKDTTNNNDKLQQLYRRIDDLVYCWKYERHNNKYYIQTRFDCDLNGSAIEYYDIFNDCQSYYKENIRQNKKYGGDKECECFIVPLTEEELRAKENIFES